MIFVGTPVSIPDVIRENFEILPILLGQRSDFLSSERLTLRDLADHDDRIAAHTDSLILAGSDAEDMLIEGISSSEPGIVLSSGFVLGCWAQPEGVDLVLKKIEELSGPALESLGVALCLAPGEPFSTGLQKLLDSSSSFSKETAIACLAFSFHGSKVSPKTFENLVVSNDSFVRKIGWSSLAYSGHEGSISPKLDFLIKDALSKEEKDIKEAAINAAIWTRQPWLINYWRTKIQSSEIQDLSSLLNFAILADENDFSLIYDSISNPSLGPERFRIAGAYGYTGIINSLLTEMCGNEPLTAVEAGRAFRKITGIDADSERMIPVISADKHDENDFKREFLENVKLPDPDIAECEWKRIADNFDPKTRYCSGIAVSCDTTCNIFDKLNLLSRYEAYMRAGYDRRWSGRKSALERLTVKIFIPT